MDFDTDILSLSAKVFSNLYCKKINSIDIVKFNKNPNFNINSIKNDCSQK